MAHPAECNCKNNYPINDKPYSINPMTLFDQYGNLNIDDLIAEQPSFQKIMEDGIVTPEKIQEQSNRVSSLLHKFEEKATPEQIEQMQEILGELSVLIIVNNKNKNIL